MHIKVDLKIFLFLLLFLITSQIEMYILLMVFAIIHELGHLLAGILLKFKPQEIKIIPIGLQISFTIDEDEIEKTKYNTLAIKRAIIALAGPIINFVIIAICIGLMAVNTELQLANIIYANFLIGTFNLLPIYPLDGGRILKELLHIFLGLKKSYTYTKKITKIVLILITAISSIAILYLQNISLVIIVAYIWVIWLKS